MTTINQVLADLQQRNREQATAEQVCRWCSDVDQYISHHIQRGGDVDYILPQDGDTPLLAPDPYDELYYFYCCARIDLDLRQYGDYSNENQLYNTLLADYAKEYLREHRPPSHGQFRF